MSAVVVRVVAARGGCSGHIAMCTVSVMSLPRTLLVTLVGLGAGGAVAAARAAWTLVNPNAIRAHVEFLADDLLEGRGAASRGYDLAATYVASQFRQAGLAPAMKDDSFFQEVPLLEATAVLPGSSAELVQDD